MKVLFINVSWDLKYEILFPALLHSCRSDSNLRASMSLPPLLAFRKNYLDLDFFLFYILVLENGTLISLGSLYCCIVSNIQFNGVPLMIILRYPTSCGSR